MRKLNINKMLPEELVLILQKKGIEVSINQAEEILELLYLLATLEVEQILKR